MRKLVTTMMAALMLMGWSIAAQNTLSSFKDVAVPFEGNGLVYVVDDAELVALGSAGYFAIGYHFTLSEAMALSISSDGDFDAFLTNNSVLSQSSLVGNPLILGSEVTGILPAGDYYLFLLSWSDDDFTYSLDIKKASTPTPAINYTELDYPYLILGTPATGNLNNETPKVQNPVWNEEQGVGYTLAVESGKTYSFSWTVYAGAFANLEAKVAILTGGSFQNNASDIISGSAAWILDSGTRIDKQFSYTATATGDIRLLLLADFDQNLMYSLLAEEDGDVGGGDSIIIEPSPQLTFTPISLPYLNENVIFNTDNGAVRNSDGDYLRGFKFTVEQDTTVLYFFFENEKEGVEWHPQMYLSDTPVDKNFYPGELEAINSGDSHIFWNAGTYYIVLSDNQFSMALKYADYYYATYLSISVNPEKPNVTMPDLPQKEMVNAITLPELLAGAQVINSLPFTAGGQFDVKSSAALVKGGDNDFQSSEHYFYAAAYAKTLAQGETVHINVAQEKAPYLYVYDTNYQRVYVSNDGDYEFTATSGNGVYYIVATTQSPYNEGGTGWYSVNVWQNDDKPVINYLSANEQEISVPADATDMQILMALAELEIEGFTNSGKVPLQNNPFQWIIAPDRQTASFAPASDIYTFASTAVLTVQFTQPIPTDLSDATVGSPLIIFPNPTNGFIYISSANDFSPVNIYNVTGKLLLQTKGNQVDLSAFDKGVYLLQTDGKLVKVVKE